MGLRGGLDGNRTTIPWTLNPQRSYYTDHAIPAPILHANTLQTCRVQMKCDGTRRCTGGEVKGKQANGVGSQYSSHYRGTALLPTIKTYDMLPSSMSYVMN